jgi:hypothetical protein
MLSSANFRKSSGLLILGDSSPDFKVVSIAPM